MYIVYVQIESDFVCVWRLGTRGVIGDGDKVPVCMRDLSPAKLKVKCFREHELQRFPSAVPSCRVTPPNIHTHADVFRTPIDGLSIRVKCFRMHLPQTVHFVSVKFYLPPVHQSLNTGEKKKNRGTQVF